jgi:hypothetical protein
LPQTSLHGQNEGGKNRSTTDQEGAGALHRKASLTPDFCAGASAPGFIGYDT